MLFGPPGQFNRAWDMEMRGFSHSSVNRGSGTGAARRIATAGWREGLRVPGRARPQPQRKVERAVVPRCGLRAGSVRPPTIRNLRHTGALRHPRDPFLTPSGASMRSSSPEILTIPAYRNTAWRLHQRAADASKRVRSAMLVPAVLRAIGTRGAFSNEFREIHRPLTRLRAVRAIDGATRGPSAVLDRASAQGTAG